MIPSNGVGKEIKREKLHLLTIGATDFTLDENKPIILDTVGSEVAIINVEAVCGDKSACNYINYPFHNGIDIDNDLCEEDIGCGCGIQLESNGCCPGEVIGECGCGKEKDECDFCPDHEHHGKGKDECGF